MPMLYNIQHTTRICSRFSVNETKNNDARCACVYLYMYLIAHLSTWVKIKRVKKKIIILNNLLFSFFLYCALILFLRHSVCLFMSPYMHVGHLTIYKNAIWTISSCVCVCVILHGNCDAFVSLYRRLFSISP